MEAIFDNKANVLNAGIRAAHDRSIIYSVTTTKSLWGRKTTYLKDANPAPGDSTIVGVIHWRDRLFEVHGQRKSLAEIKKRVGRFTNKSRIWQWSPDRKEYKVGFRREEEWEVYITSRVKFATNDDGSGTQATLETVVANFSVPFRPHLFTKSKPAVLHLSRAALTKDEVFLILVLIYSEAKRQDKMNSSGDL